MFTVRGAWVAALVGALTIVPATAPAFAGDDSGPDGKPLAERITLSKREIESLKPGRTTSKTTTTTTDQRITTTATTTSPDPKLAARVRALMGDSRVQNADVGTIVLDGHTGSEIYTRYSYHTLKPASNQKSITAAAALSLLGPGYRFSSSVFIYSRPVRGVVNGNIYLKGYGDPTMRESDLVSMAAQVRAAGITKVTGGVVADANFFDNDRYNDYWKSEWQSSYYAPQISGLTLSPSRDLDVGTIIVNYAPTTHGGRPKLTVTPASATKYVKLVNYATTSSRGTGDSITATRTPGANTITVRGRVALGRSTAKKWVTISDPAKYAAYVFRKALLSKGVSVVSSTINRGSAKAEGRIRVASDASAPLSSIMVPFLKLSNNGIGEHLVKTLGRRDGRPGTWANGTWRVRTWMGNAKANYDDLSLKDGSGLSHSNRMRARALVRVLQYARGQSWFKTYRNAMPVAGNPDRMIGGTLRHRMVDTAAENNVHAKTGSLDGVTALSGYATGADGRLYTFAMISNYTGSSPRPVEDKLAVLLAGWRR